MCGRLFKLVVWLLAASLAHLPLPVWDGDNVGSSGPADRASADQPTDMDLILLGCDVPDDADDGPTDDDPDDGTLDAGLGPAYRLTAAGGLLESQSWSFVPAALPGPGATCFEREATSSPWGDGILVYAACPRPATTVLRL
jgi:hypothetical protein